MKNQANARNQNYSTPYTKIIIMIRTDKDQIQLIMKITID